MSCGRLKTPKSCNNNNSISNRYILINAKFAPLYLVGYLLLSGKASDKGLFGQTN